MPSDYERGLKEEIWGVFKYMKIPMETIMRMPIQDRKFYIMRHNYDTEMENRKYGGDRNEMTYSTPDAINLFSRNQTEYERNKSGKN